MTQDLTRGAAVAMVIVAAVGNLFTVRKQASLLY
jgi:hypothetical protein